MTTLKTPEQILLDLIVPRGQVIPYNEGDQKSAEMAGRMLQYWAEKEAKPLIKEALKQLEAYYAEYHIGLLPKHKKSLTRPDFEWVHGFNRAINQSIEAIKEKR